MTQPVVGIKQQHANPTVCIEATNGRSEALYSVVSVRHPGQNAQPGLPLSKQRTKSRGIETVIGDPINSRDFLNRVFRKQVE